MGCSLLHYALVTYTVFTDARVGSTSELIPLGEVIFEFESSGEVFSYGLGTAGAYRWVMA